MGRRVEVTYTIELTEDGERFSIKQEAVTGLPFRNHRDIRMVNRLAKITINDAFFDFIGLLLVEEEKRRPKLRLIQGGLVQRRKRTTQGAKVPKTTRSRTVESMPQDGQS